MHPRARKPTPWQPSRRAVRPRRSRATVSMMRHDREGDRVRRPRVKKGQERMSVLLALLRRLGPDKRGAIAVVFALLFPVLIGIVGLGVETGIWYTIKRHNQSIADVVAYSGALELVGGGSCATGWANCVAAKNDAVSNGFNPSDSVNSASTLEVTTPGGVTTVTATLRHNQTPMLVSYFLGTTPLAILDRAVAQVQKINACIWGVATSGTTPFMSGTTA